MTRNWKTSDTVFSFSIYYLLFSLTDVLGSKLGINNDRVFLITSLVAIVSLFGILYLQVNTSSGIKTKIETTSKNNSKDLLIGIIVGIFLGILVLVGLFNNNQGIYFIFSIEYLRTFLHINGIFNMILFFILFVIGIPIAEEIFFRGYMYPAFEAQYNMIIAGIVTSVFSAVFLSGSVSFFLLFISGLFFAFLYQKTEAIFCSIVAHMTFNFIITLIVFIKGGS